MKRQAVVSLFLLTALGAAGCQRDAETQTRTIPPEQGGEATDLGTRPWVVNIEEATLENTSFSVARWTGDSMQMTLMSLEAGEEIGLEHEGMDQFIRIERGTARVLMGPARDDLTFDREVSDDWAIFIPGSYWHNVINTGQGELSCTRSTARPSTRREPSPYARGGRRRRARPSPVAGRTGAIPTPFTLPSD